MLNSIRKRFGVKLFLSYLAVILVGMLVLITTTRLIIPSAYEHHMAGMGQSMSEMMRDNPMMGQSIFGNFQAAVLEALMWASVAASITAVIVSWFVSRRVLTPLHGIIQASQRIAEGHYDERVRVPGNAVDTPLDEIGLLSAQFNAMASRLDETESMRRQLIGDVAHELRTPVTVVKGIMEGLMDGVYPADSQTYQQVHVEAVRLQRLVADLQELSRVESGSVSLNLKSVPVKRLVETVTSRLGRLYADKGVQLVTNLPDGTPNVQVDEERMEQVLVNVVGNALNYTPGGGKVEISCSATSFPNSQANTVTVVVNDTGIGIPQNHIGNIFARFYRVDQSRARSSGGSGIGLTIARSIIEAHHGRIWVESEGEGKGSSFFITIPAASQ